MTRNGWPGLCLDTHTHIHTHSLIFPLTLPHQTIVHNVCALHHGNLLMSGCWWLSESQKAIAAGLQLLTSVSLGVHFAALSHLTSTTVSAMTLNPLKTQTHWVTNLKYKGFELSFVQGVSGYNLATLHLLYVALISQFANPEHTYSTQTLFIKHIWNNQSWPTVIKEQTQIQCMKHTTLSNTILLYATLTVQPKQESESLRVQLNLNKKPQRKDGSSKRTKKSWGLRQNVPGETLPELWGSRAKSLDASGLKSSLRNFQQQLVGWPQHLGWGMKVKKFSWITGCQPIESLKKQNFKINWKTHFTAFYFH